MSRKFSMRDFKWISMRKTYAPNNYSNICKNTLSDSDCPFAIFNSSYLTVDAYLRCFRACGSYHSFHDRGLLPANDEAIERRNLRSSSRYGISASQMTTDMFRLL